MKMPPKRSANSIALPTSKRRAINTAATKAIKVEQEQAAQSSSQQLKQDFINLFSNKFKIKIRHFFG